MLPAQRNKVDISKLTPQEQNAFRLYGKLPSRSVNKVQERKYFDSGDYALAKAGKQKDYGKEIPTPEAIPHATPSPSLGAAGILAGSPPSSGASSGTPLSSSPSSSSGNGGIQHTSTPAVPGAIPLGSGNGPSGVDSGSGSEAINLSMSPGRVGIGASQPLATSPTRSFGSYPIAHSHSHAHSSSHSTPSPFSSSGLAPANSEQESNAGVGQPMAHMHIASTTGNQFGKTQHTRKTSQGESSAANSSSQLATGGSGSNSGAGTGSLGGTGSPPPTSGLANSIRASDNYGEDDEVQGMELQ